MVVTVSEKSTNYKANHDLFRSSECAVDFQLNTYGARARGHLIQISDGMFGWYVSVRQPLASTKMPLLSVPSGGQGCGQGQMSNECIFEKNKKMFIFSYYLIRCEIQSHWLPFNFKKSMAIWTLN